MSLSVDRESLQDIPLHVQEAECVQGTPIKSGTAVRLQHVATRRWLHSHHFPSPLSQNLEVPVSPLT